ncbi:MAG: hypothetical protein U0T81_00270 [Saprospiraceae bacterium]
MLHRFHLGYASQKLNPEIAVVILNYNGEQYLWNICRQYFSTFRAIISFMSLTTLQLMKA